MRAMARLALHAEAGPDQVGAFMHSQQAEVPIGGKVRGITRDIGIQCHHRDVQVYAPLGEVHLEDGTPGMAWRTTFASACWAIR